MMDLRELYQEIIMDHNKNPRNHQEMDEATCQARGANPLCGDKLTVYLKIDHDLIKNITFKGCGCAISQASASLMTEAAMGKTIAEANELAQQFHSMITEPGNQPATSLNKLTVLSGVKAYPARVKCATLAWHTLKAALNNVHDTVSTE